MQQNTGQTAHRTLRTREDWVFRQVSDEKSSRPIRIALFCSHSVAYLCCFSLTGTFLDTREACSDPETKCDCNNSFVFEQTATCTNQKVLTYLASACNAVVGDPSDEMNTSETHGDGISTRQPTLPDNEHLVGQRPSKLTVDAKDLRHVVIAGVRERNSHRVQVLPEKEFQLRRRVSLSKPQKCISICQDERQSSSRRSARSEADPAFGCRIGIIPLTLSCVSNFRRVNGVTYIAQYVTVRTILRRYCEPAASNHQIFSSDSGALTR